MKSLYYKTLLLFAIVIAVAGIGGNQAYAAKQQATIHSITGTGAWNSASTWVENRVPNSNDIVEVNGTVTVASHFTINELQVNPGGILKSNSTISRNITITNGLYNTGNIQSTIILYSSGPVILNTSVLSSKVYLTGGNQSLIGDFTADVILNGNVTSGVSARVKRLITNGNQFNFTTDDKFLNVEVLSGALNTNANIRFIILDENLPSTLLPSGNIQAKTISFANNARVAGNYSWTADVTTIDQGVTLESPSPSYIRIVNFYGNLVNKGTITANLKLYVNDSIDNTYGQIQSPIYFVGTDERSISGYFSKNVYLNTALTVNTNIYLKSLITSGNGITFTNDTKSLNVEILTGNVNTNGRVVIAINAASIGTQAVIDGNITAKSVTISDNARTGASVSLVADSTLIESEVILESSSSTFIKTLSIEGGVVNRGIITPYFKIYLKGSIDTLEGVINSPVYLSWASSPNNQYEFAFGDSENNFSYANLTTNSIMTEPISGTTFKDILNSDIPKYWKVRPVGGVWSEIRTFNESLVADEYDSPVPDFFTVTPIANIVSGTGTTITIQANDPEFEGELILYPEQGTIIPNKVQMNNGLASTYVHLRNSPVENKILVNSGQHYGRSNSFSVGTAQNGNLIGSIADGYAGSTVSLYGVNTYATTADSNGRFNFSNITCGTYVIKASGQSSGANVSSLPERVEVSCTGVTRHTIASATVANCNPTGKIPVLLVPGILGSTSKKSTAGVYPQLPPEAPVWNSGELKLHNVVIDIENQLPIYDAVGWQEITEKLEVEGYQKNCTIFDAPYYWPNSSEQNAREYLKKYIDHAKKVSGKSKVNIIAHSMGGLVARSYIQSDYYQNDVAKFAMVGTPNHGSPIAYYIWEHGNSIAADINGFSSPTNLITLNSFFYTNSLTNFYKVKELNSPCTSFRKDKQMFRHPIFCNNNLIKKFVRNHVPGLKDLLPVYSSSIKKFSTQENINYDENQYLLLLNNKLENLNNINAKIFIGDGKQTIQSLYVNDDGVPVYFGYLVDSDGDGTVPKNSGILSNLIITLKDGKHGGLPKKFSTELVDYML
jgi:cytoskeletal protein CcmA (bactofilin family)